MLPWVCLLSCPPGGQRGAWSIFWCTEAWIVLPMNAYSMCPEVREHSGDYRGAMWVLGFRVGLDNKCYYLLSHLSGPRIGFIAHKLFHIKISLQ